MKTAVANESKANCLKAIVRTTTDAIKVGIYTAADKAMIVPLCTAGGALGDVIRSVVVHHEITTVPGIILGAELGAGGAVLLGFVSGATKWVVGIKTNLRA